MKKVIKIKESNILDLIERVISEQTEPTAAQPISVVVSNELGTSPNFDGLKTLIKTLKTDVEKALRGSTPYKVKTNNPGGVAKASIQGSKLKLTLTLEPCKEEERDWYFDLALSIYSQVNSSAENVLTAKVMDKAAEKSRAFVGARGKIKVLGRNHIQMDQLPNLDPSDPQKTYNLYIMFVSGGRPEGYQRAEIEPDGEASTLPQTQAQNNTSANTQSSAATNETVTKTVSGTFTSNDGDTAHNFKNLEDKLGPVLKEVYDMGINPKITNISAKITKSENNQFTTSYSATVGKSNDGKAWMGFTSRGSFGTDYERRADGQIDGSTNLDGNTLEQKLKSNLSAGEMEIITTYKDSSVPVKQYFVQFTKPQQFPPHK
jgi:hypothetical protein